jgi:sugar phosphate isomerase/epimerase
MSALRLGYVTNGLANHRLLDAIDLLADCGYDGVAITLDHHHLDPFAPDLAQQIAAVAARLDGQRMSVVIETGARFLLSPRQKHQPTLVSAAGRERRIDFLRRAIQIGADLGAEAVSFWSGIADPNMSAATAWDHLLSGCEEVVKVADRHDMMLGFEPEPGMLVDRLDGYAKLLEALGAPPAFGLTLDIGHCQCLEDEPITACVRRFGDRLVQVHIEDMRRGVHDHLLFGEGEIDFQPVLGALADIHYRGLVSVELSRHSHEAHVVVPEAAHYLRLAEGAVMA